MFDALRRVLLALHTDNIEGRTNVAMSRLRALLLRAAPRTDEVLLLRQIFEHMAHSLDPAERR
jgi:tRNA C32,U32 (ribose-2'-O)-methylase TrmJ